MKILICTGIFPPDIGGPATYTPTLANELIKRGFEVRVITYADDINCRPLISDVQFPVIRVSRKYPRGLRHFIYFWRCLQLARNTNIVFAQDTISAGLPAMLAAKITRKKFIIRVAGDHAWEQAVQHFGIKDSVDDFQNKKFNLPTEALRAIQKFVVGRAAVVITPSVYFRNLVSRWIKNPDKVRVVYNGIALEDVQLSQKEAREELGLMKDAKILLSAGRLMPWKGFGVLIEAAADLLKKSLAWQLIIAGEGPERAHLESEIRDLNLVKNVLLIGAIPRKELLIYLRAADIFVLNTAFESFSFQIVEAMNLGLPIVATKIGNLEEIINNGEEGLLVEYNNRNQLIEAIEKIFLDRRLQEKLSQNARIKAQQFSSENMANNLISILKTL